MIINKLSLISAGVGVVIILVASIVGFGVLPKIIRNKIEEEVSLVEGSETWDKWSDVTRPIYFKVHFFKVTNAEEYLSGAENATFEEVGPYVYRQKRIKVNLRQPDGPRSVFYEQETHFMFDKEMSHPNLTEEDEVTIYNIPYSLVVDGMRKQLLPDNTIVSLLGYFAPDERPVQSFSVSELLFTGSSVAPYLPLLGPNPPDAFAGGKFSLYKNGSTDGEYKIQTGVGDSSLFGETILYNGKSTLGFWEPLSHCDKINGSDGSIFPPFVEKSWRIPIFSSDLCRSVDLDYHSEMEMHGIKGYRFKLARDALEDPVVNRNNRCYCKESNDMECLMDGVLDVSACKSGAPFVLSTPYFLHGHPRYSFDTNLTAVESLHETYIDIEPNSGVMMRAHKRIQLNFNHKPVKPLDPITYPYPYTTFEMIMPILWIDEAAELAEDSAKDLKDKLLSPKKAVETWRWVILAIGIVLTVGGALLYVLKDRNRRNSINISKRSSNNE